MAEDRVFNYVKEQNRPFNVQLIADMLAQFGVKKPQVQRALDALAESGKLLCKEFGKTKIYMPPQDDIPVPDKEETDSKKAQLRELTEQIKASGESIRQLKNELQMMDSALTLEELLKKEADLQKQIAPLKQKLGKLQSGTVLITKEDRDAVEKKGQVYVDAWRSRRRVFKNIWDQLSENLDQNQTEVFEEMGADTDEAVGVDMKQYESLFSGNKRRRT